jgi:hypothetical protein
MAAAAATAIKEIGNFVIVATQPLQPNHHTTILSPCQGVFPQLAKNSAEGIWVYRVLRGPQDQNRQSRLNVESGLGVSSSLVSCATLRFSLRS